MKRPPQRRVTLAYARRHFEALVAAARQGSSVFIKHRGGGRNHGAVLSATEALEREDPASVDVEASAPSLPLQPLQPLRERALGWNRSTYPKQENT